MKSIKIMAVAVIALGLVSFAFAMGHTPEEKGKKLFNDAKFAGGQKSCGSCHPDGRGLDKSADKKEFNIMGKSQKNLEDAVNFCIEQANKGKAIDVKSDEMKNIVSYIKSLKAGAKKASPGY